MYPRLVGLLLIMAISSTLSAQSEKDSLESGWGAYPVFFYTDQTNLAFGAYGIHYFRHSGAKYTSNLYTYVIYTLNKQIITEFGGQLYWKDYRLVGFTNYLKYPNIFYGIGSNSRAEDAEDFTDEGAKLDLNFQKQIISGLFLGMLYNFQSHALVQTEPDGQLASGVLPGTDQSFYVSGVGISMNYDTRDNVNFPSTGSFMQALWSYYTKTLGSDFNYIRYYIDLRHFMPLLERGVLGFQGTWTQVTNGTPVIIYPVLGDDRLRGFSARYWDKTLLTLQMEYRKLLLGYFGMTVFAGMGNVADRLQSFKIKSLKFGAGFGFRYMVLPEAKFTLRVDFGFGTGDNSSLTFIAQEAF